jgi:hypothetical protein
MNPADRIREYLERLQNLYDNIRLWSQKQGIEATEEETSLVEKNLGTYTAPALKITHSSSFIAYMKPIGTNIIGASGRVDIIGELDKDSKILVNQHPKEFSKKLHGFVEGQIEFWRIGDKLDLLKGVVDVVLIGQAKQIKNYRDWVVHKSRTPTVNVTPQQAYTVLSKIVFQISVL